MTAGTTTHAEEAARRCLRLLENETSATVGDSIAWANANATLYLADQHRLANVIAYLNSPRVDAADVEALRVMIREALQL